MPDPDRRFQISTPLGSALCSFDAQGALTELRLGRPDQAEPAQAAGVGSPAAEVARQLGEYFDGARREFELPLALAGTAFQRSVWDALRRIPYGTTTTYGELAGRLGRPDAVRAVGAANGANPVWIIIPCHRVLGSDGSLTGYAGGLEVKRRLLALEGALPPQLFD